MKRLTHLALLVVWLLSDVLTGVAIDFENQPPRAQHIAHTDVPSLTVHDDRVVLTVDLFGSAHWRIAALLPSFSVDSQPGSLRPQSAAPREATDRPTAPRESATFIPL